MQEYSEPNHSAKGWHSSQSSKQRYGQLICKNLPSQAPRQGSKNSFKKPVHVILKNSILIAQGGLEHIRLEIQTLGAIH